MAQKKSKSASKTGSKKKKSSRSGSAPKAKSAAPAAKAAPPAAEGGISPVYIGVGLAGVAIIAYVLYTQYVARPADEPSTTVTASEGEGEAAEGGDGTSLEAPADVASPPADAERTSSGLASKVLRAGTGTAHPSATTQVRVHYTGWTTDGERFDSSRERDEPSEFALDGVIAGWTEGLQLMVEGERRRFWIPEDLAYGGRPGRPAGMLVFDVELIRILD